MQAPLDEFPEWDHAEDHDDGCYEHNDYHVWELGVDVEKRDQRKYAVDAKEQTDEKHIRRNEGDASNRERAPTNLVRLPAPFLLPLMVKLPERHEDHDETTCKKHQMKPVEPLGVV